MLRLKDFMEIRQLHQRVERECDRAQVDVESENGAQAFEKGAAGVRAET